jgi:hypothetical protein
MFTLKASNLLIFVFLLISFINSGCKQNKSWSVLPEVTHIKELKQTEFVPALECPVTANKNTIYAAAFLYAWNEVKEKLGGAATSGKNHTDHFRLINQSTSFQNTLAQDEYTADAEIVNYMIIARAFFKKTLPFSSKLQKLDDPIIFDKKKIAGFGMKEFDRDVLKFTRIFYYKDDDHFILELTPADTLHRIVLAKGIGKKYTLSEAVDETYKWMELGTREKKSAQLVARYSLNEEDVFSIPVIRFNIECSYDSIRGQAFRVKGKEHHVEEAYQRTAFVLNETGAVVESEAYATVDSANSEPVRILPKKMIFDKPFVIMLRRKDSRNPYFVMKVVNSELLMKQ